MYSPFADEKYDLELGDNKAVDSLKIDSMVELEYLDNDNVAYKKDVDNMLDSGLDYFQKNHQYQSHQNFVKYWKRKNLLVH